jgi:hypothetical protein
MLCLAGAINILLLRSKGTCGVLAQTLLNFT